MRGISIEISHTTESMDNPAYCSSCTATDFNVLLSITVHIVAQCANQYIAAFRDILLLSIVAQLLVAKHHNASPV